MRPPQAMSSVIARYVLAILVITMSLGLALYTQMTRRILDAHTERLATVVAESVAANTTVRSAMAAGDPHLAVKRIGEQLREATGAAYVVIIDRDGIRHSHPNSALIGERVEEAVVALDGQTHVGIDHGSLGASANARVPLQAPDGRIVGEVSVGFLERDISRELSDKIPTLLLYTGVPLLLGAGASLVLARRLKRMTFGLELVELSALLQEREAMLHGIREGVVALDRGQRLTVVNDEARRLLDLRQSALGVPLEQLLPAGRLRDVLSGALTGPDELVLTDEHLLVVNRMPVQVHGRDVGSVVTLRDRTELEALLRELDSVNGLTEALRAQQHEFANRLHVLSVMVGLGERDEALDYLSELSATSLGQAEDLRSRIAPTALAALLLAKIAVAAERGIELSVTEDSRVEHPGPDPRALSTIVGNLLDNAMDAVVETPAPRRVMVPAVRRHRRHHHGAGLRQRARGRPGHRGAHLRRRLHHQGAARRSAARVGVGAGAPADQSARRRDHGGPREPRVIHRRPARASLRARVRHRRSCRRLTVITTLVVDDDFRVARLHAASVDRIEHFGSVGQAHSVAEALALVQSLTPQLLLLDLYLPDGHGLEVIRTLDARQHDPRPDFIVITAAHDVDSLRRGDATRRDVLPGQTFRVRPAEGATAGLSAAPRGTRRSRGGRSRGGGCPVRPAAPARDSPAEPPAPAADHGDCARRGHRGRIRHLCHGGRRDRRGEPGHGSTPPGRPGTPESGRARPELRQRRAPGTSLPALLPASGRPTRTVSRVTGWPTCRPAPIRSTTGIPRLRRSRAGPPEHRPDAGWPGPVE